MNSGVLQHKTIITDPSSRQIAETIQRDFGYKVEDRSHNVSIASNGGKLITTIPRDLRDLAIAGLRDGESLYASKVNRVSRFNQSFNRMLKELREDGFADPENLRKIYKLADSDHFDFQMNFEGESSPLEKIILLSFEDPQVYEGVEFTPKLLEDSKQEEIDELRLEYAQRHEIDYAFEFELGWQISLEDLKTEFPDFQIPKIESTKSKSYLNQATDITEALLKIAKNKGVIFSHPMRREMSGANPKPINSTANLKIIDWLLEHNAHLPEIHLDLGNDSLDHKEPEYDRNYAYFSSRIDALVTINELGITTDKRELIEELERQALVSFTVSLDGFGKAAAKDYLFYLTKNNHFLSEDFMLKLFELAKNRGLNLAEAQDNFYGGNLLFTMVHSILENTDYANALPLKVIKLLVKENTDPFKRAENWHLYDHGSLAMVYGQQETRLSSDFVKEETIRAVTEPVETSLNIIPDRMSAHAFNALKLAYKKAKESLDSQDSSLSPNQRLNIQAFLDTSIDALGLFKKFGEDQASTKS